MKNYQQQKSSALDEQLQDQMQVLYENRSIGRVSQTLPEFAEQELEEDTKFAKLFRDRENPKKD